MELVDENEAGRGKDDCTLMYMMLKLRVEIEMI